MKGSSTLRRFLILLLFILILPLPLFGQENQKLPSWSDTLRRSTVAIGRTSICKKKEEGLEVAKPCFEVIGTGVLFGIPKDGIPKEDTKEGGKDVGQGYVWLVTAKHVFYDPSKDWEPDYIQVRFSWFEEDSIYDNLGTRIDLKKDGKRLWFSHPNEKVDLACIQLRMSQEQLGIESVPVQLFKYFKYFVTPEDIYDSASVLVFGYSKAVGSDFWNKAILRQGIIAWASPTNPESNIILIDSNIFPGNSGGPVFKTNMGLSRDGHAFTFGGVKFLGIVSRVPLQELPKVIITTQQEHSSQAEMQSQSTKQQEQLAYLPSFYMGIGIVEPASRVRELLEETTRNLKPN